MRHDISRSIFGARLQLWLSTATLAAVGICSSALAQERPVPAPAPAPNDANAEGTIVVVGNRSRATTALESPVPIDVIAESQFAARRAGRIVAQLQLADRQFFLLEQRCAPGGPARLGRVACAGAGERQTAPQ